MLSAQAASIQVVSIIHKIKVRKIEAANSTQVANTSTPLLNIPVGPQGLRLCTFEFQGGLLCDLSGGGYHRCIVALLPLTRRFLRTSENSRYAKFARISGSFPKRPGKGPIGRVNFGHPAPLCWPPALVSSAEVNSDLNSSKDLHAP
jgi:hypothetical protein